MAALHCTVENPEEQMYTDFGNLNRFDDDTFSQLSVIIFDFLSDPKQVCAQQQSLNCTKAFRLLYSASCVCDFRVPIL